MFSHCNFVWPNKLTEKVQSRLTIASVSVEDGGVMQDCHPVSVGGKPPRTSSSSPESKETKDQSQSKVKSDHLQISWYLDSSSAAAAEGDGKAEESSGFQGCGWDNICLILKNLSLPAVLKATFHSGIGSHWSLQGYKSYYNDILIFSWICRTRHL